MKEINLKTWNRSVLFNHFKDFEDPSFSITFNIDVTNAYRFSKEKFYPFFPIYLHSCMRALNEVENLRYRINESGQVLDCEVMHASATILRQNKTFGFTWIKFSENLENFIGNFESEKNRVLKSTELFPPVNGLNCIHCSAIPWINFTGHKEPFFGHNNGIPKLAFGKKFNNNKTILMSVAINVNHSLVDGYHLGLFNDKFQSYLNDY